jgi:dipeptidyl aminopeptidase/acylaminoacyl peptidase
VTTEAPYQCGLRFNYSKGFVGFPRIVARGTDQAIVCDWTGTISLIDLPGKSVVRSENVAWVFQGQPLGCTSLTSLQGHPETTDSCVVATRGAYAALWDLESSEVRKIETGGGPVNAVAYSPDGTRLAIGTGHYDLSSGRIVRPTIQVWELADSGPTRLKFTTLPGQCVDTILWEPYSERIICVSGDSSQESGYLCCLDGDSLHSLCLDRIPLAFVSRILAVGDSYLVAHRGGVQAYDRDDFSPRWSHAEDVESADLAHDEETGILFFGGTTFLESDGEVVGKAEFPGTF